LDASQATASRTWGFGDLALGPVETRLGAASGVQATDGEAGALVGLRRRRSDQFLIAAEGRDDAFGPGDVRRVVISRRDEFWRLQGLKPGRGRFEFRDLRELRQVPAHDRQIEGARVDISRRGRHGRRVLTPEMDV
jgi:hypothetical protein